MEVLVNLSLNLQSPRFSTVGNRASLQPTSHWLISARPLVYKSSLLVSTSSNVLAGFTVMNAAENHHSYTLDAVRLYITPYARPSQA